MRDISKAELTEIIEKHGKWLRAEDGGERADLRSADLSYANLSYADLSYADLSYADLRSANLSSANLSSANLSYADLSYANLSYADLSYANLRSANLSSANLSYADLSYANLSSANLSYANLRSANLSSAYSLDEAMMPGCAGNMRELKSLFLDTYQITYTYKHLQIGCEKHLIKEWWKFTDAEIRSMDGAKAVKWWKSYKAFIKRAIKISPATEIIGADNE